MTTATPTAASASATEDVGVIAVRLRRRLAQPVASPAE
jgi:hypothetical protein